MVQMLFSMTLLTENREKLGMEIALKKGLTKTLIKPYDDLDVIAGQGTVGKRNC